MPFSKKLLKFIEGSKPPGKFLGEKEIAGVPGNGTKRQFSHSWIYIEERGRSFAKQCGLGRKSGWPREMRLGRKKGNTWPGPMIEWRAEEGKGGDVCNR